MKLHVIAELRPSLLTMLSRDELGEGKWLADSAYDSEQIFKACFERDLIPVVKPRKSSKKGRFRRRARECFSGEVHCFRGVAESV